METRTVKVEIKAVMTMILHKGDSKLAVLDDLQDAVNDLVKEDETLQVTDFQIQEFKEF